jgi:hypothetical protein
MASFVSFLMHVRRTMRNRLHHMPRRDHWWDAERHPLGVSVGWAIVRRRACQFAKVFASFYKKKCLLFLTWEDPARGPALQGLVDRAALLKK